MELHKRFILLYMSPPERSVSGRKKKKESLGFPFLLFFPHLLPSFFCLTRIYERLRFCAILRRVSLMLVRLLNYEASDMHWIPLWMKINSGLEKYYTEFLDTFFFLQHDTSFDSKYFFWFITGLQIHICIKRCVLSIRYFIHVFLHITYISISLNFLQI